MSTAVTPRGNTQPAAQTKPLPLRVIDMVQGSGMFEKALPTAYKPFAERYLTLARLYIARKPELHVCTPASLAQCVLSAAEHGLCLDGRMAHAVKFNVKKKGADGRESWEAEATYMPSYFGIIDVCRRHGAIVDAIAEHVHENDEFVFYMENGKYQHRWTPALGNRGKHIGCFCLLILPGDRFRVVYMSEDELNHVRNKSKSKDNGPWVTDTGEMQKKTVLKRALKTYITDPDTADMLAADDHASGFIDDGTPAIAAPKPTSLDQHAAASRPALTNSPSVPIDMPGESETDMVMDEPPTFTEQPQEAATHVADAGEYFGRLARCASITDVDKLIAEAKDASISNDDFNTLSEDAKAKREAIRAGRGGKEKQGTFPQ